MECIPFKSNPKERKVSGLRKTQALTAKLRSQAGASMVVALVFFLLCMMVGCVVLTAASVNIGKVESDRRAHQQYLAVSSAARLLKRELTAATIEVSTVTTKITTTTVTGGENPSTQVKQEEETEGPTVKAENSLLSGLTWETLPAEKPLTVTAPDMPEVRGTISVADDYTLTVVLMDDRNGNVLTMVFPAVQSEPAITVTQSKATNPENTETVETVVTETKKTISWGTPKITGAAPEITGGSL